MAKLDPRGKVSNPIDSRLANSLVTPFKQVSKGKQLKKDKQPEARESTEIRLTKTKRVLFTAIEQKENDKVVQLIADMTGADTLNWSHISRAMWALLRRSQDHINQKKLIPELKRPANADSIGLAQFEDTLSDYLLSVFKELPR